MDIGTQLYFDKQAEKRELLRGAILDCFEKACDAGYVYFCPYCSSHVFDRFECHKALTAIQRPDYENGEISLYELYDRVGNEFVAIEALLESGNNIKPREIRPEYGVDVHPVVVTVFNGQGSERMTLCRKCAAIEGWEMGDEVRLYNS